MNGLAHSGQRCSMKVLRRRSSLREVLLDDGDGADYSGEMSSDDEFDGQFDEETERGEEQSCDDEMPVRKGIDFIETLSELFGSNYICAHCRAIDFDYLLTDPALSTTSVPDWNINHLNEQSGCVLCQLFNAAKQLCEVGDPFYRLSQIGLQNDDLESRQSEKVVGLVVASAPGASRFRDFDGFIVDINEIPVAFGSSRSSLVLIFYVSATG